MPLQPIDSGLWCAPGHFQTFAFRGSTRMIVLGGERGLVLYSPVELTTEDESAIRAIGPVVAIIAPNTYHHLYLRAAAEAFPDARVYAPQGLQEKTALPPRAEEISRARPPLLPAGIEHFIMDRHRIRECVLFHHPTRTLVTADLLYNYQAENGRGEKLFFRVLGCYGSPKVAFYHRFAIGDKTAVRELVGQVRRWRPQRIVMCHGRIVESAQAAEVFARAWEPFS